MSAKGVCSLAVPEGRPSVPAVQHKRYPTEFGARAGPSIARSGNQLMPTNRMLPMRLATQSSYSTIRLIQGIWAMFFCQNGVPHVSMFGIYPACLVPRVTCAQCLRDKEDTVDTASILQESKAGVENAHAGVRHHRTLPSWVSLTRMVGDCDWACGTRGCAWGRPNHSPRCEGRAVDWVVHGDIVAAWLAVGQTPAMVRLALSPMVTIPQMTDPSPTAHKRLGSLFWQTCVVKVCYMQFADKAALSSLLTKFGNKVDRIVAICDGPVTKTEARFNHNNALMYNELIRAENVFGSVATTARDVALITGHSIGAKEDGAPLVARNKSARDTSAEARTKDTIPCEQDKEEEKEKEGTPNTPALATRAGQGSEDKEDDNDDDDVDVDDDVDNDHKKTTADIVSSDKDSRMLAGATGLQAPNTTPQFDEEEQHVRELDAAAAEMSRVFAPRVPETPPPAGIELRTSINRDLGRRVQQYVLSPHTLTVFMISNPYFHKHVTLSEDEALERLGVRQITAELLPAISERDPMCVLHGITLPDHDHAGASTSAETKMDVGTVLRKRRPPRIIAVIGDENSEEYYRVVRHTPGSNDLTKMIETPTRTAGHERRFAFLTAQHLLGK